MQDLIIRHVGERKEIAFLFNSCMYHGHQCCAKGRKMLNCVSGIDRYRITMVQKENYIRLEYEVTTI